MTPAPGTPVRCELTKWGDRPHWQMAGVLLGSDAHGDWLGYRAGTLHTRPGAAFRSAVDTVSLAPADGWSISTFHAPGTWCDLYVDVTGQPRWDGTTLRAVDLDLDVIRMADPPADRHRPAGLVAGPGEVLVDDEDEFAEHQVLLGYPPELVAGARASCDAVLAAVVAGRAPYDGSHRRWLAELARVSASSGP